MSEFSKLHGSLKLGSWSFNVLELTDIDMYSDYIRKTEYPANLWSSNFAFLWATSQSRIRKALWRIVDDMLVTFTYLRSGELYLKCLPFGSGNPEKVVDVVYKCLMYCYNWNDKDGSSTVVKVINSQQLDFLRQCEKFDEYFRIVRLTGLEKHFSIPKLLTLSGKEFETVRRKINKFQRLCPDAIVREYKDEDLDKVLELGEYWKNTSGQKYPAVFDNVYFPEIIKHHKELEHMVLVVEDKNRIIGLVSGGELPTGQSWWCISKFMNDYDGLSDFLIVEIAKAIHRSNPDIELMNAAEDMGPGGLRYFKEKFRPVLDLRRYLIKLR